MLILAFSPILPSVIGFTLTAANGCKLMPPGQPCIIGGVDMTDTLTAMVLAHWLIAMTIPLSIALAVIWALIINWKGAVK